MGAVVSMDQPGSPRRAQGLRRAKDEVRRANPSEVRTVRAVEFIRRMRGASQPQLLRCEDGASYVVKFQNNPQHIRILANEMLAGRLAGLIGLPTPDLAIVEVAHELQEKIPSPQTESGRPRQPCVAGLQFGSRFPGIPSQTLVVDFLPDRLLRRVSNLPAAFMGGFVFDKWTCNCDGRQMIFYRSADQEGSGYSASLIDYGFCFNDGEWDFPDSPIRSLYPRRVVYEGVRGLRSFEPFLSLIENLEAWQLEKCAQGVPNEWCGGDSKQLLRLAERLYERRRRLRQAIIDARECSLKPFPNWE